MQEARKPTDWLGPLSAYAIGALVSSTALGALLGTVGAVIFPRLGSTATIVVAVFGIALAMCDFGVAGAHTPTLHRQTYPVWWRTFGRTPALFLWGFDLGLGFTTIRVASLYWIVALIVVALASPLVGATILGAYGVALVLNLTIATWVLECRDRSVASTVCILRLDKPLARSLAIILLVWSLALLVFALGVVRA